MKCGSCDQRKGKRLCPAKNSLLCAQCCGEKRMVEIDCPESCRHLKAGREKEVQDYAKRIRTLDPHAQERNRRVLQDHQEVIGRLEYALARERILSHDLSDGDVAQAVDILLETYRTENNGILYEKTSDDLRVETLRRELRSIIESLRHPEGSEGKGIVDPQSTRLTLGAAIDCLEFIRSILAVYLTDKQSSSGYVNFLARIMPRNNPAGSLIVS
jgi:hypothetical protein